MKVPMRATVIVAAALVATAVPPAHRTATAHAPGTAALQQHPGEAIFLGKGNCFACHGRDGTGTPVAPDLTDGAWINFDARPTRDAVVALLKQGVPRPVDHPAPMPPMGGASLDDDEIAAVAAYVLELSPPVGG